MSNMSRGRKDLYGPRRPKKTTQDIIDETLPGVAAARAAGKRNISGAAKMVQKPKAAAKKPQAGPTKAAAAKMKADAKATRRTKVAGALSQAGTDMAASSKQGQDQFGAEHDQAAAEGRAYRDRMQQSTPGKAMDIIKRRRV